MLTGQKNRRIFLIGEHLSHSFSPEIHAYLSDYSYSLRELPPDFVGDFLKTGNFDGLNVTIPYKKAVLPYLSGISPEAERIGAVNTIIRKNGGLYGENTDYAGFLAMLRESGLSFAGKKAVVLGSGGASHTVCTVLRDLSCREVTVISRTGENNYANICRHADCDVLVNTTPVGMYPDNGASPVDLTVFSHLSGVFDLIYNPAVTALLFQAKKMGIPAYNGLTMLVAQAVRAAELFTGESLPDNTVKTVTAAIRKKRQNIVLLGMPGCGKSTVGRRLAEMLHRPFYDTDAMIEEKHGSIPEIFRTEGESAFRRYETEACAEAGKQTAAVIATGGGVVTRPENELPLRQNGVTVYLSRPLSELATAGRPLSRQAGVERLFRERKPLYEAFADCTVPVDGDAQVTAERIQKEINL